MGELTQEILHEHALYDKDTGIFTWKKRGRGRQMERALGSPDTVILLVLIGITLTITGEQYLRIRILAPTKRI